MPQTDKLKLSPTPAAVVWDLDGTLVESAPDLATALNSLLEEHGCQGHSVAQVRPMIGAGVAKLIERGFQAANAPLDAAGAEALVPRFLELYTACATDQTHLIDNAHDVLAYFERAGARQALCTNKPYDVTMQILETLGIAKYFAVVIGGDSTDYKKPHPAPLLTCLEELGIPADDAVMIGDSGADVGAAKGAGVPIILVPDGYTGVPAVSLGADFVVGSLAEVPACLVPRSGNRLSA